MMKEEIPIRFRNKDPLVVGNTVFHSSHAWDLTEMELEKARVELGETEEKKQKLLQEMKDKLSKEGNYRLDDTFLLRFLRVRKFDCDKAYLNVKNYYDVRKKHPNFYGNPSNFSSLKCHSHAACLPYADEGGRLITWGDFGCWNPREASFAEAMQLINAIGDLYLMNPRFQVNGVIGIWDCKDLNARHVAEILRSNQILAVATFLLFSFPWRISKVLAFNTGRLTRIFYNMIRPLLTKKLAERNLNRLKMMQEEVPIRYRNKEPLVVGNTVFHSSNAWDLSEAELEKAHVELGETEEKKRKFLQEIKDRLSKEGNYRLDDNFLLRFLRVRKYDCERAYLNVKNFYAVRKKHHDWYGNPSNLSSLKSYSHATCLPYADEGGRLINWGDFGCWNPREASFAEAMQLVNAIGDLYLMNPRSQVNGVVGIWDCKELSARHVAEILRSNQMLTAASFLLFSFPWRIKKIIAFNTGRLTRIFYSIIRPLLTKKQAERIFLLGSDVNELHQHVNPAILPKMLGGELEDDACRGPNFILDNIPYLEYERSFTGAWDHS